MIICALGAGAGGHAGAQGRVELLGQPCRAKQILAGRVVVDRASGRELFVLTNMNEVAGAELIFIDYERDTGQVFRAPAGAGAWALCEVPGDRLIVGTFYDGKFMVFDLKQMAFVHVADFPGEEYIWRFALGQDDRLYGGTYPGGKLGALNLDDYSVEDCGRGAPPNMYLSSVSTTPNGRILCSLGQETAVQLLYDPTTKRFEPVPETLRGVGEGMTWGQYFLAGSAVFRGSDFERVDPPFPTPPADKGGWYVDRTLSTADALYVRQANAVYRWRPGEAELTLVADLELRGGVYWAATRDGALLGVRGQDYFVLRPGDTDLKLRPIPVESAPRQTLFLEADAHGRVWGGPSFGQTLFHMDGATGETVNTGAVCDAGGEVYDVTFLDGRVYTASYAGGDITVYDPAQPWDQWGHVNPRPLARVGPAYIRPTAGILTGPDRKLYSGWMARYGTYGGCVAITDPETGETEVIADPLGAQAVQALAVDAKYAYVGTTLGANGLPEKTAEAPRFGVIDLATRQVVFQQEVADTSAVGHLYHDARTGLVLVRVRGQLRVFDPAELAFAAELPQDTPVVSSETVVGRGDGVAYYGHGRRVIALDLTARTASTVADLPANVERIAISPDGIIYAASGTDVYRVTLP